MKKNTSEISFTPLFDRVVVHVEKNTSEKSENKFGIITSAIPEKALGNTGTVVAVGAGRWNEDGDARIPLSVSVGDEVLFQKYDAEELEIGGESYAIFKEQSILGIFK